MRAWRETFCAYPRRHAWSVIRGKKWPILHKYDIEKNIWSILGNRLCTPPHKRVPLSALMKGFLKNTPPWCPHRTSGLYCELAYNIGQMLFCNIILGKKNFSWKWVDIEKIPSLPFNPAKGSHKTRHKIWGTVPAPPVFNLP